MFLCYYAHNRMRLYAFHCFVGKRWHGHFEDNQKKYFIERVFTDIVEFVKFLHSEYLKIRHRETEISLCRITRFVE